MLTAKITIIQQVLNYIELSYNIKLICALKI